jgi:hypothetical protein
VIEGMTVVDAIATVDTDYYDAPLSPVIIKSIVFVEESRTAYKYKEGKTLEGSCRIYQFSRLYG